MSPNPLERLGAPPAAAGSWWLHEVRLTGFRRPVAQLTCSCGSAWTGSAGEIVKAAEHLALRRHQIPEHRVQLQWTTSATMVARKRWR